MQKALENKREAIPPAHISSGAYLRGFAGVPSGR